MLIALGELGPREQSELAIIIQITNDYVLFCINYVRGDSPAAFAARTDNILYSFSSS